MNKRWVVDCDGCGATVNKSSAVLVEISEAPLMPLLMRTEADSLPAHREGPVNPGRLELQTGDLCQACWRTIAEAFDKLPCGPASSCGYDRVDPSDLEERPSADPSPLFLEEAYRDVPEDVRDHIIAMWKGNDGFTLDGWRKQLDWLMVGCKKYGSLPAFLETRRVRNREELERWREEDH
jgi:hypothetical protein